MLLISFGVWRVFPELLPSWPTSKEPRSGAAEPRKRLTFVDANGSEFGDISIAIVNASRGEQKGVFFEHDAELFFLRIGGYPENYFADPGSDMLANTGYLNDACIGQRVFMDTAEAFASSQRSQHGLPLAYLEDNNVFRMTLSERQVDPSQLTPLSTDDTGILRAGIWRLKRQADGTELCTGQDTGILISGSGADEQLSLPVLNQVHIRDVNYAPPLHLELR